MKTIWKVLAVGSAVLTVGGTLFLYSRPAQAKALGAKAFKVSPDCLDVEIVDEDAGRAALTAAIPIAFKGMSERADLLLLRLLSYVLSPCVPTDAMKIRGIPGVPFGVTVAQIKAIIGDRTVEQVGELAAQGGLPGIPGLEGASASTMNPVNALLAWATGGDY